jgi:uncharacterized membrane protein YkgB
MERTQQAAARTIYMDLNRIDAMITGWMARHGVTFARVSLGIVFLWFGGLKLFPGLSPAEELAGKTIHALTAGLIDPALAVRSVGLWECLLGAGLLTGWMLRLTLYSLFLHMAGTTTPILLFPGEVFAKFPYAMTFEGQYIMKNMVLVSAAIVVGATLRGGALVAEPCDGEYRPYAGYVMNNDEKN